MPGPTITTWNRLEPRPRSRRGAIRSSLEARIRDPFWVLARQWQLGEFYGEDAGSPIFVKFKATSSKIDKLISSSGEERNIQNERSGHLIAPIEYLVQKEQFSNNSMLKVELSQRFIKYLKNSELNEIDIIALTHLLKNDFPLSNLIPSISLNQLLFDDLFTNFDPDRQLVINQRIPVEIENLFSSHQLHLSSSSIFIGTGQGVQWNKHWIIKDSEKGVSYALIMFSEFPDRFWVYQCQTIDKMTINFLKVCSRTSFDGVTLYNTLQNLTPNFLQLINDLTDEIEIPYQGNNRLYQTLDLIATTENQRIIESLFLSFVTWVDDVYGGLINTEDSPYWEKKILNYNSKLEAGIPEESILQKKKSLFSISPNRKGEFDWYSFDQLNVEIPNLPYETKEIDRLVGPDRVSFSGMPHARFWRFENNSTNYANIRAGKLDLSKLLY